MALVGPFGLQLIQMVRSVQHSLRDLEAALNQINWPRQPCASPRRPYLGHAALSTGLS